MNTFTSNIIIESNKKFEDYKNGKLIPEYIKIEEMIKQLDLYKLQQQIKLEQTMLDIQIQYKFNYYGELKF